MVYQCTQEHVMFLSQKLRKTKINDESGGVK